MSQKEPVNVGITALQLRRLPLERSRFDAFVQIHCTAPKPVAAKLDMRMDGTLVAVRNLTLPPGGKEKLLVPVDAGRDAERVLSLSISAERDVLESDDAVHARIPRLRPVNVLWISESPDPFTELALATLGANRDIEVLQGSPSVWPPQDPVDIVIFDGWLPDKWPEEGSVLVIDPPRTLGPVRAVRLAAALGFALAPETEVLIRRDGAGVARVSGERIRDEVARLLVLPRAANHLDQLDKLGLLTVVFPELEPLRDRAQSPPHSLDALDHSLETVRGLELVLGALDFEGAASPRGTG